MPINVAFGATNLYKGLNNKGIDGIGHYCQELLHSLAKFNQVEVTPFSFGHAIDMQRCYQLPKYPRYALNSLFSSALKPIDDRSNKYSFNQFDLVHATDQLMPINLDRPLIATVMDVIPLTHPNLAPSKLSFIKALLWKKLSRSADHIITISEFSKEQIALHMQYPQENISVIPLGVDQRYFDRIDQQNLNSILEKFSLPNDFFLHVGTIQPRKNIVQILHAHSLLPNGYAKKYPLVLAGRYGWGNQSQYKIIEQAIKEKRCIHINYVSDIEKRALLQSALAMTFISLYEGFGLPIIEAFASRTPVITSCTSSMIEVAHDAAILVDPLSTDEIKTSLLSIIKNKGAHQPKVDEGFQRAKQFSWERTARHTLSIYKRFA